MKHVRFDKSCKCVCRYITLEKWYEVINEYKSTYVIKDDSNTVCGYPKAWVAEEMI